MDQTPIREGFLCPICMQDLGTVSQLHEHFEQAHSEDKDVLNQLKGLFGKAKRKILGRDREEDDVAAAFSSEVVAQSTGGATALTVSGIDPTMWEPQELGAWRSHIDNFKRIRDGRIDRFVVETNKLLIRLDKLLSPDAPTEPSKRKAYEKSVVPWAPDSDVKICTSCGKSFGLTRRRHHCRLCGSILCNKCSHFLPFSYAKKLINPACHYRGEGFHRSSSNSSLNSMLSPDGEVGVRTCAECRTLLERRDQQMEQRNTKPLISQLYERMRQYMEETEMILPEYLKMADSLNAGETSYSLHDVQQRRLKVMKLYESIDALSKRISALGLNDPEPPSPRHAQLQRMVRLNASNFLQENILGLQSLPTEEELVKLQEAKTLEAQRRIEEERRAAAEREAHRKEEQRRQQEKEKEKDKFRARPVAGSSGSPKHSLKAAGWKPVEVRPHGAADDDPMVQQMNIIRGYIKQARQAQKWDEVQMLEDNLKELQRAYWSQHESPS